MLDPMKQFYSDARVVFFRLCISKASFVDVSHTFATFLFEATVLKCRFRFIFASSHIRCWLVERHLRISLHCNFSAKDGQLVCKEGGGEIATISLFCWKMSNSSPALVWRSLMFPGPICCFKLQWRDVCMALRLCDTIKTNMTLQNNKIIMT